MIGPMGPLGILAVIAVSGLFFLLTRDPPDIGNAAALTIATCLCAGGVWLVRRRRPAIKPDETVLRPRGRVPAVEFTPDVTVDGIGKKVLIRYRDRAGKETSRVVTVQSIAGPLDTARNQVDAREFIGFCHLRKAVRTFKVDNILGLYDPETGEAIEDPTGYFAKARTPTNAQPTKGGYRPLRSRKQ